MLEYSLRLLHHHIVTDEESIPASVLVSPASFNEIMYTYLYHRTPTSTAARVGYTSSLPTEEFPAPEHMHYLPVQIPSSDTPWTPPKE